MARVRYIIYGQHCFIPFWVRGFQLVSNGHTLTWLLLFKPYDFYLISKDHLCTVTFGLMYSLYSRAAYDGTRTVNASPQFKKLFLFKVPINRCSQIKPTNLTLKGDAITADLSFKSSNLIFFYIIQISHHFQSTSI